MRSPLGGALVIVLAAVISLGGCMAAPHPAGVALPPARPCPPPKQTNAGSYVFYACSAPAKLGVVYCFHLYTHCGLGFGPDFDGSFWTPVDARFANNGNPPAGLGNPYDDGTIELLSHGLAEYRAASGQTYRFRRLPGHRAVRPLCA